jgi:hypothetical protein
LIIVDKLNESFILAGVPQQLASQAVSQTLADKAEKLGVEVNPKYGKWNAESAAVESSDPTNGAVTTLP